MHAQQLKRLEAGILILGILLLVSGCLKLLYPPQPTIVAITDGAEPSEGYLELTEDDAFSIKDVQSSDISIFGVHLGSPMEDVITKIGQPDLSNAPTPTSINFEYKERFNMSKIGLLFHFDNNTVTRITVKRPFNTYLHGQTAINHTKEDLYRMFGKPDKMQLLTFFTVYSYYDQGIEVFLDGPKMNGFSLIYPQPEKARENTK